MSLTILLSSSKILLKPEFCGGPPMAKLHARHGTAKCPSCGRAARYSPAPTGQTSSLYTCDPCGLRTSADDSEWCDTRWHPSRDGDTLILVWEGKPALLGIYTAWHATGQDELALQEMHDAVEVGDVEKIAEIAERWCVGTARRRVGSVLCLESTTLSVVP